MPKQYSHARARLGAIAGATAALVAAATLVAAGPAAAHVHVDGDAEPGERATLTFRVPTESDTASTTGITVTLPTDTPITSLRAQSKPGWEVELERVELDPPVTSGNVTITSAFGSITWTATGEGIAPDEFDEFVVQLGPIPDAEELVLPTEQVYSDGTVVAWDEVAEGGVEPEDPAPVLQIGEVGPEAPAVDVLAVSGLVTGIVGIVLAALALAVAVRRRP